MGAVTITLIAAFCALLVIAHNQGIDGILINVSLPDIGNLPFYCHYCSCREEPDGTIYSDCSHKGLFKPPRNLNVNTSVLNMHANLIKTIKNTYFANMTKLRILDLSTNTISVIKNESFRDCVNLEMLFLNGNKFKIALQAVIRPGIFKGLTKLRTLSLQDCITYPDYGVSRIPTAALTELTNLETLSIDGVAYAKFNNDFRNLTKLATLIMTGKPEQGECFIKELTRQSFEGLPHLKYLEMDTCDIKTIEVDTFSSLWKLEYLDLSWNMNIEFKQFGVFSYGLKYLPLKVLKINAIHNPYRAGSEILRGYIRNIRDMQLTELHMDDNGIEFIDYGVFALLPKTIKKVSMRRNRLTFGLYTDEVVFNNPDMTMFDAGDQHLEIRSDNVFQSFPRYVRSVKRQKGDVIKSLESDGIQSKKSNRKKRSETEPKVKLELKTLICSGSMSRIRYLNFSDTINNLTTMDLSGNYKPRIDGDTFIGLDNLRFLNLSGNFIEHVRENTFKGLDSVELLDLNDNLLGRAIALDTNGTMFSPLRNTQQLQLSKNRISNIGKNIFTKMPNLESVDLSDNYLEHLDVDFRNVEKLYVLNLSRNHIQNIQDHVRMTLDKIARKHKVNVDLTLNQLACNCETIPFVKWFATSKVNFVNIDQYYCSLNNGAVRYFNETGRILSDLEEECKSYLGIIVAAVTGGSFILAVICSYIVYSQRWKLRYLYYMAKVKFEQENDGYQDIRYDHDVFLSYGDGDRLFVIQEVLLQLENNRGIRLNIRDRDFDLGEMIAVNISKAIRTSKKTFLCLSTHFLKSKWCNFETNMARMEAIQMKREVIGIIFLEDIPNADLPIEILDLLRECPSLDMPKDEQLRPAFWDMCADLVR